MRIVIACVLSLLVSPVWAQSVQQSGSVTPGHPAMWTTNGIVQDAGTPQQGFITGLGIQNNGGPGICINSAPITAPYNELCFSVSTTGSALISLQNYGGATGQSLQCDINGVTTGCFGSSSTGSSSAGQYLVNSAGTVGGLGGTNCVMIESAGIPLCSTVSNSNLANMAADTVKCNSTSGLAAPTDCTLGQGANYLTSTVLQIEPATARMWPHVNQASLPNTSAWNAVDPWGNPISCVGTTSQCLQEFITAAATNGWPAEVHCQGNNVGLGIEPVVIEATASVSVPVVQDWHFHADGTCNLNFNVTTVPGLVVDSQGASWFLWDGKIVYNVTTPGGTPGSPSTTSCAVLINPVTNTQDGFPGLYAGVFRVKGPVANPVTGTMTATVCISTATGSTIQQTLDFGEMNANNASNYGLVVYGASSTTGLLYNIITVEQTHGAILTGINEGYADNGHTANYNSNLWKINNIENTGASSRGIDVYGTFDTWEIGVINNGQGGLAYGIVTELGASFNNFRFGQIVGFSSGLKLDSGKNNVFQGMGTLYFTPSPFSSLATCGGSSVTAGSLAMVSDSTTVTWGATIAGGGGNSVLALCDASNVWTVVGK